MARTSIAAAKAELFAFLGSADNASTITGVTAAYNHERAPGDMQKPVSLTVSLVNQTPEFWTFAVRLYCTTDVDAGEAAVALDTIIPLVDDAIDARWGPEGWTVGLRTDLNALIGECFVQCGREDI